MQDHSQRQRLFPGSSTPETAVTLRHLHYRLCAEGLIPSRPWAYRKLPSHLAASRRAGRGPDLVDPTREIHVPVAWADAGELLAEVPERFRLDRAAGQAVALYVCAEKSTLHALFSS
ncbi:hypothetical protein Aros01_07313 [Streptosporangium roseum]|uniref:hypothetical protein n=1 Tax=Streptosporangium roseum TaxID=2001 RepID=UPI0030B33141